MDMYVICEALMKVMSLVVISCVLNQNCGHWLFEDALKFIIVSCMMSLQIRLFFIIWVT
jgi:hypothetical protein